MSKLLPSSTQWAALRTQESLISVPPHQQPREPGVLRQACHFHSHCVAVCGRTPSVRLHLHFWLPF
eukprot:8692361-Pyramimonas_sp.AAC.1